MNSSKAPRSRLEAQGGTGSRLQAARFRFHPAAGAGALLLALATTGACAKGRPAVPAPRGGVAVAVAPLPNLRAELDQLFTTPALQRATWAVHIESLDRGETLYSLNAGRLMMPASNMKILTLAAAAERLGWDHRLATHILATAPIEQGVLRGDLIVIGGGDPTINSRATDRPPVLDEWARELWDRGLRSIEGRIIGDDNAFDDEGLGAGWAWDYLAYGYAAPTGALEFNENAVEITIRPGASAGDPVAVDLLSAGHGLVIVNRLATAEMGSEANIELRRLPGTATLELHGSVPAAAAPLTRTASVDNPTVFLVSAFQAALAARGISVSHDPVDVDALHAPPPSIMGPELLVHQSPPLSEIATTLMKLSQNAYADTLLKALGRTAGVGSAAAGRAMVREVLEGWGIGPDSYVMYDGSGLSRYNYVTADTLVRILRRMADDPKHAPFAATLPIAGQDGTLARRMRGTRAEGNARAKTGSIANVRSLSGYVTTADGERIVFSMLANHFNVPQDQVDAITDRAVDRLATFSRAPRSLEPGDRRIGGTGERGDGSRKLEWLNRSTEEQTEERRN